MDAATALRAIKKGWLLIPLGILAAIATAVIIQSSAMPIYETSAKYVVSPLQDPAVIGDSVRTLDDARSRAIVSTFAEVLGSASLRREAAATLGLDDAGLSEYSFDAVVLPEANVVELTVRGPGARISVMLSAAVGGLGSQRFIELYQIYDIVVLDPAATPTSPVNPSLMETAAVAGGLGLLAGSALALLWGGPRLRRGRRLHRRLESYGSREPTAVVTPLPNPEDRRVAGAG